MQVLHQPLVIITWIFWAGLAGVVMNMVTANDLINLTSTITSEDHLLWPEEEVVFTCETRGLVLEWTSDDYIGEGGIALEFSVFIDNLGDMRTVDQSGSTAILTSVAHNMASQLRIMTSSQFPTSSVTCTNFNATSAPIEFSVLACLPPTQDGILIPRIQNSQRNDNITFTCKEGYQSSEEISTRCLCNGTWTTDPNNITCTDINECENQDVCPGNSQCINTNGSYTCVCDEGYFHVYVPTENINECQDVDECMFSGMNTCDNSSRAECVNLPGNYTCVCTSGYKGDGRTCHMFDDSTCDTICDHHCVQNMSPDATSDTGPRCACDRGYYLAPDGITCIDINECGVPAYSHFCTNGTCRNTDGSYECICNSGFINNGTTECIDQDECELDSLNNCDDNATCTNTIGSFDCECNAMYFGDGVTCIRGIAPKISRTSTPDKPNHGLQYDVGTGFCVEDPMDFHSTITCQLEMNPIPAPEFIWNVTLNGIELPSDNVWYENGTLNLTGPISTLDNTSTIYVICDVSNTFGDDIANTSIRLCDSTECQDGVTNNCTQECTRDTDTGAYNCSCLEGYHIKDRTTCHDIDECANDEKICGSDIEICLNELPPIQYTCVCKSGYSGGTGNCEDENECEDDTKYDCPPSSECININGSYACMCINNTRKNEQTGKCLDINECSEGSHNCSKYAKCNNFHGGFSCECRTGYEGDGVTCTLSREVIIGTSVTIGLVLIGILLLLISIGSVKIGRHIKLFLQLKANLKQRQEKIQHEMSVIHDHDIDENKDLESSMYTAPERYMVVRGSMKSKLPPALVIKSRNLRVLDPIGQGEFGIVYKGCLAGQYTDEIVAIKTLKGFVDDNAVQELLRECARMKHFSNLHVMSLKGVCLDGGPVPYIVLPYMANGSLAAYLKKERKNLVMTKDKTCSDENEPQSQDLVVFIRKRLMDMCLQVAKGMEYLTSENVVHRDLAARNCMIDINMIIKIADFGLSVNIGAKEYYRLTKHVDVKLPVKWMAPESLADYMFSEMSDVWSFGVTCWEIFTGAQAPYAGVRSSALLSFLQEGERLEMPNNSACNTDLYSMMRWCWEMEPGDRPSFSTLVKTLSESLEKQAGYLCVSAFTNNPDYEKRVDLSSDK